MPQKAPSKHSTPPHYHEEILVLPRAALFEHIPTWHGLTDIPEAAIKQLIEKLQTYVPRVQAEQDSSYKQIIPYLVFTHDNRFFLTKRSEQASEQRLKSKLSLGIGGHVRRDDVIGASLFDWAQREWNEEVSYHGDTQAEFIGLLNDDTTTVSMLHLGAVFVIHGSTPDISIKSELVAGSMRTLDECEAYRPYLEGWSQHVLDFLKKRPAEKTNK